MYLSKRAKDGNYVEKREEESGNITYVYDEKHIKERNKKKAEKLNKLSKSLSTVRKQVKKDISSKDDRIRLSAIAVALIDETYERVGNRYSAADMRHYGVTTWLVKHIKFPGNTARIKYVGKSGIKQDKTVSTPKLVSALKSLCEGKKPSDLILTIEDLVINDNIVNQYLRPFHITAKDIRGLHANVEVRKQLQGKTPTDEKERKKKFKEAVEEAAKIVGHKPATLKNQYLVPGFEEKYIAKGQIIGPKNAELNISKRAQQSNTVCTMIAQNNGWKLIWDIVQFANQAAKISPNEIIQEISAAAAKLQQGCTGPHASSSDAYNYAALTRFTSLVKELISPNGPYPTTQFTNHIKVLDKNFETILITRAIQISDYRTP